MSRLNKVLSLILTAVTAVGCSRELPMPMSYADHRLLELEAEMQMPPSALFNWDYPTPQTNLLSSDLEGVFQPTASGRLTSALYGSVRTLSGPRGLYASFHEGIDIAAVSRDRQGRPLDKIKAIAPGKIAYANKIIGNSNYGNYVVLTHEDPIGSFYTLYAHLASVAPDIAPGMVIERGTTLGIMGNTPASIIPMARAHMHFEIGVMLNSKFDTWFKARHMTPDHGCYNGLNLAGLDPLDILENAAKAADFSLKSYMADLPAAFAMIFKTEQCPDYFQRYPSLWIGAPHTASATVHVFVSEGGVPLRGRMATPEEEAALGKKKALVTDVDDNILGRNGRRLILRSAGTWAPSKSGENWLAIMKH